MMMGGIVMDHQDAAYKFQLQKFLKNHRDKLILKVLILKLQMIHFHWILKNKNRGKWLLINKLTPLKYPLIS